MAPLLSPNVNIPQRDGSTHTRHTRDDVSSVGVLSLRHPVGDGGATADSLPQYLALLGLEEEEAIEPALVKRGTSAAALSPRDIGVLSRDVSVVRDKVPHRGAGAVGPSSINNKGMLALFALLFSGLIISAIWFFFWAKNGGFRFKEGDWEEYKSTVLRRKGPNGTTLSDATKTTDLGKRSIAGSFDAEEDNSVDENVPDNDVREYRHETSAKVGGMNKEPDGSYYDRDSTDLASEVTAEPAAKGRRGFWHRGERSSTAPRNINVANNNRQPSTSYSFTEGDDGTTVSGASEYVRPNTHRPRHHGSNHSSHRTNQHHRPSSGTTSRRHYAYHPPTISEVSYSDQASDQASDLGTKIYNHSVPGLLAGSVVAKTETTFEPEEERAARRERERQMGYRRGGGRRRDSLSDSDDGETVA